MACRVAIIDYGMGNLYSVSNTFRSLGIKAEIVDKPAELQSYDKLILPGVGAFGDAMKELKARKFIMPIKDFIASGKPFLGICLGMQLLLEKSEESKGVAGLAIIPGAGHLYCERYKDAAIAFILNSAMIYAAYEAFDNNLDALGGIITFFELGFYSGNIYSAVNCAHKYNRNANKNFFEYLRQNSRINLGLSPGQEKEKAAALVLSYHIRF